MLWQSQKHSENDKPKSFINNQLLSKHQVNHENFPCAKCQKNFGAKRNLLRHQKTVHKASEDEENAAKNLEEPQNNIGLNIVNMDLNSVDLSDLLVMPLDPLPLDPLTQAIVLPIDF